jgi:hypothetical protein
MEVTDEHWRLLAVLFPSTEVRAKQTDGSISPATEINKAAWQVTGEPRPKRFLEPESWDLT